MWYGISWNILVISEYRPEFCRKMYVMLCIVDIDFTTGYTWSLFVYLKGEIKVTVTWHFFNGFSEQESCRLLCGL